MSKTITTRTVDGVHVHTVTAGSPYDVATHASAIGDGDVIVVGDVVGVRLLGHTCAVTRRVGEFAYLDTDASPWATVAGGAYSDAYNVAVIVAAQLGAPVIRSGGPAKRRVPARQEARSAPVPRQAATRTTAGSSATTRAAAASTAVAGRAHTPRRAAPAVPFTASDTTKAR